MKKETDSKEADFKKEADSKKGTVQSQILHGYMITILIIVCLVAVSSFCLFMINNDYKKLFISRSNQINTQEAITAHYQWLDKLNISIQTDAEFTGSLDYNTCALGKWLSGVSPDDLQDPEINQAVSTLQTPHQTIHSLAKDILELSKTDGDAAFAQYASEIEPNTRTVIDNLTTISGRYKVLSENSSERLGQFIRLSLIAGIVLAVCSVFFALRYAFSISRKISAPIHAVADWSHKLSLGAENIDFNMDSKLLNDCHEINTMVHAFEIMAHSIQNNVNVVKRVADGDMTAFVNIRSSQDSLGKNLYRMVQTNDIMFSEILDVAQKVAQGSNEITDVSKSLATSTSIQANAVQGLSSTIDEANDLIEQNATKTNTANDIAQRVRKNSTVCTEKMNQLLSSVEEIHSASKKVSAVIKTIDDIAFQTNILALNAAVEAARAGDAGKGFAVVAGEVRQLALNSANAVTESKQLIESTIGKTQDGTKISLETSDVFKTITNEIDGIVELIFEISSSSASQLQGIQKVRSEIAEIYNASESNVHISAQSADASNHMRDNADMLRQFMGKFVLRKRQEGQAYIPPEKQNDQEYIRKANALYQQAKKTGEVHGYVDPAEVNDVY